jgi:hypothetical protein
MALIGSLVQTPATRSHSLKGGEGLHRIWNALFTPVDISFLVFFRLVFGAIMLWEVYRYFDHGWILRHYIEPQIYFSYYGFSWVKPWPGAWMYVHFLALGALAVCILVGFYYRIAATLFFLGFTYVFLLDQTKYLNHFYLIVLLSFLLIWVPAARAFSLDAWRKPKLRSATAPGWTLWLLRAQLGIAYFYGGVAKLNSDWLQGEPMRMWLAASMDFPVIGPFFREEWMVYGFVIGGLLLDLLVVPLLLWRRTRLYAFLATVLFHCLNALLFRIGIFPWFMLLATLIFFDPDLPRRIVGVFWKGAERRRPAAQHTDLAPVPTFAAAPPRDRIVAALIAAYLAVQLVVPLRHHLYPGDVNWTEEGHLFAWHMKLRDKSAEAVFFITDPASGKKWKVKPDRYLKARQRDKMATRPDLILQFSHFLAAEMRKAGYANVEVRAQVMASLNGRAPQLLVDPTVDLTKERRSLWPARWIVPLTEPLGRGNAPPREVDS